MKMTITGARLLRTARSAMPTPAGNISQPRQRQRASTGTQAGSRANTAGDFFTDHR
jgi:hypothetical protein